MSSSTTSVAAHVAAGLVLAAAAVTASTLLPDHLDTPAWSVGCLATGVVALTILGTLGRGAERATPPAWAGAVVVLAAVAGTVVGWVDDGAAAALARAVAVLVGALPVTGLGAVVAARSGVRRHCRRLGVRFRDTGAFTRAGLVDTLRLDPDGIVTTGELEVDDVHAVDPDHERSLRWFAGALAHSSDDAVGRAVARLSARGRVTGVEHVRGAGVSGDVDRHPVRLGRPDWVGLADDVDGSDRATTVGVEVDGRALGLITMTPVLVPDAAAWLGRLRALGVEPVLAPQPDPRAGAELAQRLGLVVLDDLRSGERRAAGVVAVVTGSGEPAPDGAALSIARTSAGSAGTVGTGGSAGTAGLEVDGDIAAVTGALALARSTPSALTAGRRLGLAFLVAAPVAVAGLVPPVGAVAVAVVGLLASAGLCLRGLGRPTTPLTPR